MRRPWPEKALLYHDAFPIPVKAVDLRLLFANLAAGKIETLTIPLSEVQPSGASTHK